MSRGSWQTWVVRRYAESRLAHRHINAPVHRDSAWAERLRETVLRAANGSQPGHDAPPFRIRRVDTVDLDERSGESDTYTKTAFTVTGPEAGFGDIERAMGSEG